MKSLFVVGLTVLFSLSAKADFKQYFFERAREAKNSARFEAKAPQASLFSQRLDHFSNDTRRFNQRYYLNSDFAMSSQSPVFYYVCGEAVCNGPTEAVKAWAREFKAHIVTLEHRYYGKSHPFRQLTTENMKYLSTHQALEDLAVFQNFAQIKFNLHGKWISIGGSYPGSLSAYYRVKYPDLVVGALASSAPVEARDNFEDYDHHVAKVAGEKCGKAIRKVVAEIEAAESNPMKWAQVVKKFAAEKLVENDDFLYLVADIGAAAVQYGLRDKFCSAVEKNGLDGYASIALYIYQWFKIDAVTMSAQGALDLNPESYPDLGMRAWFYQSCQEYGYWQNAYHDSAISVRSSRISPAYHRNLCKRLYGITHSPDTERINDEFLKPMLNGQATNIFFTNGSEDPWSRLSITQINGNMQSNAAYVIEGAAHCDDLRTPTLADSSELKKARKLFSELVKTWLLN